MVDICEWLVIEIKQESCLKNIGIIKLLILLKYF